MKVFIQKYTKLPYFQEIKENKLQPIVESEKLIGYKIRNTEYLKSNEFINFIKFRIKYIIISLIVSIFTIYSLFQMNIATNGFSKSNGLIAIFFSLAYIFMMYKYLEDIYCGKSIKNYQYYVFIGFLYILISAIFQYHVLSLFTFHFLDNVLTQIVLYNYFYIFIFNSLFFYLKNIFENDYNLKKSKRMNYFISKEKVILVVYND